MKNLKFPPLFYLTIIFIAGIITSDFLKISLFLLLSSFFFVLFFYVFALKLNFRYKVAFPYLLFFLIGLILTTFHLNSLENGLLSSVAREQIPAEVSGVVISEPRKLPEAISFTLRVDKLRTDSGDWCLNERLKVYLKGESIQLGDRVTFKDKILFPQNEGDFDYAKYLARRRIKTMAFIEPAEIKEIKSTENVFLKAIMLVRSKTKEAFSKFLSDGKGAVLLGILFGDTSEIAEDTLENFRATGLSHVLAVSGLHVGILIGVCVLFACLLRLSPLNRVIIICLSVAFYSAITLGRPSILRALLMTMAGSAAWFLGRKNNLLSSVSFAALALLAYDPFMLYDIGFQLSFAATLGVILLAPVFEGVMSDVPLGLKKSIVLSVSAQVAVAPFLISYFGEVSQIGVLANLLVVPALAPILTLGLMASILSLISLTLAESVCLIVAPIVSYVLWITKALAAIPGAAIYFHSNSLLFFVGYFLVLLVGIQAVKFYKPRIDFPRLIILFLIVAVIFTWTQATKNPVPDRLVVTFLDVGQGDSILIQTPEGATVLVDGGESSSILKTELLQRGVRKIDMLVLTHPHADHVGGLVWVVKNLKVEQVLDSGQPHTLYHYKDFLKTIDKRKIAYKLARQGQNFLVGEYLEVEVLHPQENLISGTRSDLNNNSVVLKLTYGEFDLLLPGDIEEEPESLICESGLDIHVDVLKVSHHGSAHSLGNEFFKKVSPEVAIISVGGANPFGHPAKSTINKLKKSQVRIYRTDKDGTITITSDGKSFEVTTEK